MSSEHPFGFALINKPRGLTSFDVVLRVRRVVHERRVGHTGTLDPMATGLLIVAVGEATKLIPLFERDDKTYDAEMTLGTATNSEDADGTITEQAEVPSLARETIESAIARFVGPSMQIPPMVSALKRNGQRLYALARAGIEVPREPRPIVVHELEILTIDLPRIAFRACVSKGTYIRTLAVDIARALGTIAHLSALLRISAGSVSIDAATTLAAFEGAPRLIAPLTLLRGACTIALDHAETHAAYLGKRIQIARNRAAPAATPLAIRPSRPCPSSDPSSLFCAAAPSLAADCPVVLLNPSNDVVGLAEWVDETWLQPRRMLNLN